MTADVRDYYLNIREPSPLGLQVLHSGEQDCPPGHCFGYATRGHYLLHYIVDGCGEYYIGRQVYRLKKGDGFLIPPGASTLYRASEKNPWSYRWVGFGGAAAEKLLEEAGLGENRLIFHYDADDFLIRCLTRLEESCKTASGSDLSRSGYLLLLLGKLYGQSLRAESRSQAGKKSHFDQAVRFIENNYTRSIRVSDIAGYVGIDRSQLYRIFEGTAHCSPQEYLAGYRMDRAGILIQTTELSFGEVASSVGFEYSSHFYRRFKERFGVTPSEFRKRNRANRSEEPPE